MKDNPVRCAVCGHRRIWLYSVGGLLCCSWQCADRLDGVVAWWKQ
jgi:hypothetical protein